MLSPAAYSGIYSLLNNSLTMRLTLQSNSIAALESGSYPQAFQELATLLFKPRSVFADKILFEEKLLIRSADTQYLVPLEQIFMEYPDKSLKNFYDVIIKFFINPSNILNSELKYRTTSIIESSIIPIGSIETLGCNSKNNQPALFGLDFSRANNYGVAAFHNFFTKSDGYLRTKARKIIPKPVLIRDEAMRKRANGNQISLVDIAMNALLKFLAIKHLKRDKC